MKSGETKHDLVNLAKSIFLEVPAYPCISLYILFYSEEGAEGQAEPNPDLVSISHRETYPAVFSGRLGFEGRAQSILKRRGVLYKGMP